MAAGARDNRVKCGAGWQNLKRMIRIFFWLGRCRGGKSPA